MKRVIRKLYWDYDKEEKWINEMADRGLALVDYTWGKYTFEETPPGEYIYRIELLEKDSTSYKSQEYIRFVEESGAECVACYMRWIYFRRRREEGVFELYSDNTSKIKHLKGICSFYTFFIILELFVAILNIGVGIFSTEVKVHFIWAGILILIALEFARLLLKIKLKIRTIEEDGEIYE